MLMLNIFCPSAIPIRAARVVDLSRAEQGPINGDDAHNPIHTVEM